MHYFTYTLSLLYTHTHRLGPALEAEQEAGTSAGSRAGVSGRRLGPALDAEEGLVAGGWDQRWIQSRGWWQETGTSAGCRAGGWDQIGRAHV